MTDETGLLEHALGRIPRRREGYTTDDNARALWVCMEWLPHVEMTDQSEWKEALWQLIDRYLAFLLWVQRDDGTFHNNIGYDRSPEPEAPSDDCLGRTLWACAVASVRLPDDGRRLAASNMFANARQHIGQLRFPRGMAYTLAACSLLVENGRDPSLQGDVEKLEASLIKMYRQSADQEWRWFEPMLTYANGLLPWSLFRAYRVTRREETLAVAQTSLDFLIDQMTGQAGQIRPVGNEGWCSRERRSDWDQQPLDVMKLALAAAEAAQVLGDNRYLQVLQKCRNWFYGENDLGLPMVDPEEGSCCDGLTPNGVNPNQGAESTLSYLLTEVMWRKQYQEVDDHGDHNIS
ncbi:MAG: glycosyl transferase [Brevibacillus sp.]|nr:glycosyl transferase [Brevibacillus sp.]